MTYLDGHFYWVRMNDEWTIGRYDANEDGSVGLEWSVVGSDEVFDPSDFDKISYEVERY